MTVRGLLAVICSLALLGCPSDPPPQAPTWTVRLRGVGDDPAAVIAAVVSIRGCTPTLAKKLVDGARAQSLPVRVGLGQAEAEAGAEALRRAGASADAYQVP